MLSKFRLFLLLIIAGCAVFLLTQVTALLNKKSYRVINSVSVLTSNHYHSDTGKKEDNVSNNEQKDLTNKNKKIIEPESGFLDTIARETVEKAENDNELKNKDHTQLLVHIKNEEAKKENANDSNKGSVKQEEKKPLKNVKEEIVDETKKEKDTRKIEVEKNKVLDKDNNNISISKTITHNKNEEKKNKPSGKDTGLPLCSKKGENLVGPLFIDQSIPKNMKVVEESLSVEYGGTVEKGGWWEPSTCTPRTKVAIIIPYRNRFEQLKIFLRHLHPFLQRQQFYYRIIVVDMLGDDPFNRAGLFNIGFVEALKLTNFDCFVFTDVDLLPEDDRNYYGCPTSPRHMSVAVDKFNYILPYATIFGGVGAFKKEHFEKINGMSNMFWGWGGEDDDLYGRITESGFKLTRPSVQLGRYTMIRIHHFQSSKADPNRMNLLANSKQRMTVDGLNTLKYEVKEIVEEPLVTFVKIIMKKSMYIRS